MAESESVGFGTMDDLVQALTVEGQAKSHRIAELEAALGRIETLTPPGSIVSTVVRDTLKSRELTKR